MVSIDDKPELIIGIELQKICALLGFIILALFLTIMIGGLIVYAKIEKLKIRISELEAQQSEKEPEIQETKE